MSAGSKRETARAKKTEQREQKMRVRENGRKIMMRRGGGSNKKEWVRDRKEKNERQGEGKMVGIVSASKKTAKDRLK